MIKPIKLAIMEDSGVREGSYLPNYSLLSGFHVSSTDKQMLEAMASRSLDTEFETVKEKVTCTRLDNWMLINKINHVHLLKIDVEKAELSVLRSLGSRISCIDAVLVEVHYETKESVLQLLTVAGFTIVSVSDPTPPTFCLKNNQYSRFNVGLSTYMVWAKKLPFATICDKHVSD
jgi:FkbM family methyltransferase